MDDTGTKMKFKNGMKITDHDKLTKLTTYEVKVNT